MALLAAYALDKNNGSLAGFLSEKVFAGAKTTVTQPDRVDAEGFAKFLKRYTAGLDAEKAAGKIEN